MKNVQISLILLAILGTALCQDNATSTTAATNKSAGGYFQIVIQGNEDPQACLYRLINRLSSNKIEFQADKYDPFSDCTQQNLQLASIHNNEIVGNISLVNQAWNTNIYIGEFTTAQLQQYNGTACVNIAPGSDDDIYLCHFKYGRIYFYFFFTTDPVTYEIRTNWVNLFFPQALSTVVVAQNDTHVWKPDNSQNGVINGQLYSECGGWSTSIPNKDNHVLVTGTIYNSQRVNLGALIGSMNTYGVVIHPRDTAVGNYWSQYVNGSGFNANQTGDCSDLGVTYDNIVPNLAHCKGNGCEVTIILIGNQSILALQTGGFLYTGNLRLRA